MKYFIFSICILSLALFFGCSQSNKTVSSNIPGNVKEKITTTRGTITVRLFDLTPLHRDNFVKLGKSKFYDGIIFHRVIKDFMIQAGDPDSKNAVPGTRYGSGGPDYIIPAEIRPELFHKKGALSAARTGDQTNPERASSGSQFYIVQGKVFTLNSLKELELKKQQVLPGFKFSDEAIKIYTTIGGAPHLDGLYTVFGEVIDGIEIVDRIANSKTNTDDRPLEDIMIKKIR